MGDGTWLCFCALWFRLLWHVSGFSEGLMFGFRARLLQKCVEKPDPSSSEPKWESDDTSKWHNHTTIMTADWRFWNIDGKEKLYTSITSLSYRRLVSEFFCLVQFSDLVSRCSSASYLLNQATARVTICLHILFWTINESSMVKQNWMHAQFITDLCRCIPQSWKKLCIYCTL